MKYFRRFIWYVAERLLLICCIAGLMTTTFYYAMNAANIQIILKDGMAKRAQVIMMGESDEGLTNYFSPAYLRSDAVYQNAKNGHSVYQNHYNITGIDHRLKMNWVWCWPWDDVAKATMTEEIPRIDGKIKPSSREKMTENGLTNAPPEWPKAEYAVVLSKENGRWTVKNMTQTKVLHDK